MAQKAREAVADSSFRDFASSLGSLGAVESWVRANYVYRDEQEEIIRTPQFMLADMGRDDNGRTVALEGDCDDVATLLAALTKALGYPSRLVAIRFNPANPNFEHVFTEVYDGERWKILDATVQPGTEIDSLEDMVEVI